MKIMIAAIIFLLLSIKIFSQVSINPSILYLDKNTRTGFFDVLNPSKEVREFSLDFQFGYPVYDENGIQSMKYDDSLMANEYSLIPYLKYFPKKLVIPPGETQTVRFMINNLPEIGDKTFWTRVIGSSESVTKQIDTSSKDLLPGQVRPILMIKSVINAIIFYQKGNVTSSVDFKFKKHFKDSVNSHFLLEFEKTGNSPFLGMINYKIFDSNDNVLVEHSLNLAIYKNSIIDIGNKSSELGSGKLKLEATVLNGRGNIPADFHIPFEPVTKTFIISQ